MIRPRPLILIFGLNLALLIGATGWVSWTALKLDMAQVQARRQATLEEDVRLALWRMDSALASLIARENSRPYFAYNAFYPAERAYSSMFAGNRQDEQLLPSPLLTEETPDVLLYFQVEPSGTLTSPQVPPPGRASLAQAPPLLAERLDAFRVRLQRAGQWLRQDSLLAMLKEPGGDDSVLAMSNDAAIDRGSKDAPRVQSKLSSAEYQARLRNVQQAAQFANQQSLPIAPPSADDRPSARQQVVQEQRLQVQQTEALSSQDHQEIVQGPTIQASADQVAIGIVSPLWIAEELILARRVRVAGQSYVQGCWLDWPTLRRSLLDSVADVLPTASLEPVKVAPTGEAQRSRMLAALPVRLVPGDTPAEPARTITPIRLSLAMAWACVLIAIVAVVLLLAGTLRLSERRATFVSSVTHELRTPLTTLRMYAEMLAAGMVTDPDRRQRYLDTLQREADRLGHLVENVLAYARLERGRAPGRLETVSLAAVLDRATERLSSRAEQAGVTLTVACPPEAAGTMVRTDLSAVEQILFNLVDNACKYAAAADSRCIEISAEVRDRHACVKVRDLGPGISLDQSRRLFEPFGKSARDAAHSAPGVGLGLALSRRLAREMRGDLQLDATVQPGACFVLTMPLGREDGHV